MAQQPGLIRDPEDRVIDEQNEGEVREKMLDKTIADSFPASDPPSSIPVFPTRTMTRSRPSWTLQRERTPVLFYRRAIFCIRIVSPHAML